MKMATAKLFRRVSRHKHHIKSKRMKRSFCRRVYVGEVELVGSLPSFPLGIPTFNDRSLDYFITRFFRVLGRMDLALTL